MGSGIKDQESGTRTSIWIFTSGSVADASLNRHEIKFLVWFWKLLLVLLKTWSWMSPEGGDEVGLEHRAPN